MLIIAPPNLWALSLCGSDEWSQLAPTGSQPPYAPRSTVYDPVLDRVIVIGGYGAVEGVWALNLSPAPQWQVLSPLGTAPAMRLAAPAVYDAARGRVIFYGGWRPGAGCSTQYWSDLWALQLVPPGLLTASTPSSALRVSAAIPNPTRSGSRVSLDLPQAAFVRAAVYDLGGRLVRDIVSRAFEPGPHEVSWDGTDVSGRSAPTGIYFVSIAAGSDRFVLRIVRLR
jgi:hypothetical protein